MPGAVDRVFRRHAPLAARGGRDPLEPAAHDGDRGGRPRRRGCVARRAAFSAWVFRQLRRRGVEQVLAAAVLVVAGALAIPLLGLPSRGGASLDECRDALPPRPAGQEALSRLVAQARGLHPGLRPWLRPFAFVLLNWVFDVACPAAGLRALARHHPAYRCVELPATPLGTTRRAPRRTYCEWRSQRRPSRRPPQRQSFGRRSVHVSPGAMVTARSASTTRIADSSESGTAISSCPLRRRTPTPQ